MSCCILLQTKTPRAATSNLHPPEASGDLFKAFCHRKNEELKASHNMSQVLAVPISTSAVLEELVPL